MRGNVFISIGTSALALATACAAAAPPVPAGKAPVRIAGSDESSFVLGFAVPMDTTVPLGPVTVRTTPAREVTCFWDEDGKLSLCEMPLAPLPRATRVRVHLGPGLRTADGGPFTPAELSFDTDAPHLEASAIGWSEGTPTLELTSDIKLRAGTLDGKVVLRSGDRTWPVTLAARGPSVTGGMRFAVQWPADVPADTPLQLHVNGPFFAQEGDLPGSVTGALATFRTRVPPRLAGVECVSGAGDNAALRGSAGPGTCREGGLVQMRWTTHLDDASRARVLAALPEGARARFDDDSHAQRGGEFVGPGATLTVDDLRAGDVVAWRGTDALRARDGRVVAMNDVHMVVTPAAGRAVLSDLAVPPAFRARVLPRVGDAPSFEAGWVGFDGRLHGGRFLVPATPGNVHTLRTPEIDRLLARGGWVEWNLPFALSERVASWSPPFDVRVASVPHAVAVWAVQWDGREPIRGAVVELSRISEADGVTVVAQGRTDATGLALLALPTDVQGGDRVRWGVRVRQGTRVASQLLDVVEPLGRAYAADDIAWMVTDRLVYRPGDTVRFSAWRRARAGSEVRVPAQDTTRFKVRRFGGEWPGIEVDVHWDSEGRATGALQLPLDAETGDHCVFGLMEEAVCFRVVPTPAASVWIDVARVGGVDGLAFDLVAGRWNGDALGAGTRWSGSVFLADTSPEELFPAWRGYAFLPIERPTSVNLPLEVVPGTDGHARAVVRTDVVPAAALPLFGALQLRGAVIGPGDAYTDVNREDLPWAPSASATYVGLRVGTPYPAVGEALPVQAVVIRADGTAIPGARVSIEVQDAEADAPPVRARCDVATGSPQVCPLASLPPGRYRLRARSGHAVVSEQDIEVGGLARTPEQAPAAARWEWVDGAQGPGEPARIRLHHGFAQADVLVLAHGSDAAVVARVARIPSGGELALPNDDGGGVVTSRGWTVIVRERARDGAPAVPRWQVVNVTAPATGSLPPSPLAVAFAPNGASLQVRNTGAVPVTAVVSVLDEASAVLAPWQWQHRMPAASSARAQFTWGMRDVVTPTAPSLSTPRGHRMPDDDGAEPEPCRAVYRLKDAPTAWLRTANPNAACQAGSGASPFWSEQSEGMDDVITIHVGGIAPVWHEYTAPVARDHAWPAGAPRGGDAWARHQPVLWEPGVTLAPGETRTFALPAAAHPVHWVARAWTVVAPGVVTASDAHVAVEPTPQE